MSRRQAPGETQVSRDVARVCHATGFSSIRFIRGCLTVRRYRKHYSLASLSGTHCQREGVNRLASQQQLVRVVNEYLISIHTTSWLVDIDVPGCYQIICLPKSVRLMNNMVQVQRSHWLLVNRIFPSMAVKPFHRNVQACQSCPDFQHRLQKSLVHSDTADAAAMSASWLLQAEGSVETAVK